MVTVMIKFYYGTYLLSIIKFYCSCVYKEKRYIYKGGGGWGGGLYIKLALSFTFYVVAVVVVVVASVFLFSIRTILYYFLIITSNSW